MKGIKRMLLKKSSDFILKHPEIFLTLYKLGIIKASKDEVEKYLKKKDNKHDRE